MKAELGVGLHNKFDIQLINSDDKIIQSITAYNIVLNNYYTNLSNNSNIYFGRLNLGIGMGTPSVTDTALFTQLTYKNFDFSKSQVTYLGLNEYSVATSLTFTETEAIGQITELGVSNRNSVLYTHAMVTDAEGSVISINKTNTDRLIITITMYLTLTRPANVVSFHGVSSECFSVYGESATKGSSYLEQIILAGLGFNTNIAPNGLYMYYSLSPGCPYNSIRTGNPESIPVCMQCSTTYTNSIIRIQNNTRVLSTDCNLIGTYQIYGMTTPIGYIPITSDIFPTLPLTLSKTASGDQTAFNFGIAELMSDVRVYINDVLQPANSYTWNGKDYSIFQAWETCRADYVIKTPAAASYSSYYNICGTPIFNYTPMCGNDPRWLNRELIYDFKMIMHFTRAYKPNASTSYTNWQYSTDGTNWTTLTIPASPSTNYYDFPTPISARYLRMTNAVNGSGWRRNNSTVDTYWLPSHPELCCYSDQLVFNTAPPAGSIIKIEAKSAYPIKNEHWILDQFVLDLRISRA